MVKNDTFYIKRTIQELIKKHLSSEEITMIVGPRQAGKTTLMNRLREELDGDGSLTVYFNLDIEKDFSLFTSQQLFVNELNLRFGGKFAYVFIDEIQRKEDAGLFLKGLYDQKLPYKFIISGSGSVELKGKIHESLAGRKRLFEVHTIDLTEFIAYKTDYNYLNDEKHFFDSNPELARILFEEYLNFGGYPKVVTTALSEEKKKVMNEIFSSYVEKDIAELLNIKKTDAFVKLVNYISFTTGTLVNLADVSSSVGLSWPTLKDYLWYLEKTFIIKSILPYFTNPLTELSKSEMYYFEDLGVKNFATNTFGNVTASNLVPYSFQNYVFNELTKITGDTNISVNYWRTKSKAEVDLVLDLGKYPIPVEVKYSDCSNANVSRSLASFIDKYNVKEAFIVHMGKKIDRDFYTGNCKLHFLSFFEISDIANFLN